MSVKTLNERGNKMKEELTTNGSLMEKFQHPDEEAEIEIIENYHANWDDGYTPYWPVKYLREKGYYFYNQNISGYSHGSIVEMANKSKMIMLGSYSYLGLNRHERINQAALKAIENYGTGTHGARLLAGTIDLHKEQEETIAAFKGTESAITFTSGYLANVSTIAAISGKDDTIYSDRLDHASIIDGCRLSAANWKFFKHNDMNHLEKLLNRNKSNGRKIIIVDAVYSMDGDIADLPSLVELSKKYSAILMIDEAHSLGVLGEKGRGIVEHFNLPADSVHIYMGAMGKAIPSMGGYIASTKKMCDFLAHSSRGFIYTAALPPAAIAASTEAFRIMEEEPNHHRRLTQNIQTMQKMVSRFNLSCQTESAIFPIICGEDEDAWRVANYCQARGVYVQAIPSPVVPQGMARLRASITAAHTNEELKYSAEVIAEALAEVGKQV